MKTYVDTSDRYWVTIDDEDWTQISMDAYLIHGPYYGNWWYLPQNWDLGFAPHYAASCGEQILRDGM